MNFSAVQEEGHIPTVLGTCFVFRAPTYAQPISSTSSYYPKTIITTFPLSFHLKMANIDCGYCGEREETECPPWLHSWGCFSTNPSPFPHHTPT